MPESFYSARRVALQVESNLNLSNSLSWEEFRFNVDKLCLFRDLKMECFVTALTSARLQYVYARLSVT